MAAARPATFADLLRRLRRAAGLSQEELAAHAGLSRNGISELERGLKRAPHKDTVARLADALQLTGAERAVFEAAARGRAAEAKAPEQTRAAWLPAPPVLVGRERELTHLDRFLAGDAPPLLLLAGEPGIGKSRLLREAAARARAAGWAVLEGGCRRRAGLPPFAPLLEALARHLAGRSQAQLRNDLQGASWLVRLLPELADMAVVPAPRWALPPEQERRLMFDAVARYLANVADPAGTLLLLDDLQWAGSDALDLLSSLVSVARAASGPPLLVLGVYRSTEVPADHPLSDLLADLARDGLADDLPLGPLAPGEARSLLESLLAGAEDTTERLGRAALIDRLLERAGGVPFYLVSCVRAAQAEAERGTEHGLSAEADTVPWDAAQSIRQRIMLLPAGAAGLLGGAALVGQRVERTLVEALSAWLGLDHSAVAAALAAAQHGRLLLEESGGTYRFAHDLIREVAAADLGAWRRRAAHRVIAEALESHLTQPERGLRAAELALHFTQGGEILRALPYLERAGEQAQARYANAEAERIYRELLRYYEELGRPLDVARVAERVGRVLNTMALHDEAIVLLTQAAHAYQGSGDMDGYARAMAAVGRAHSTSGGVDTAIPLLESVARSLDATVPSRGAMAVHTMLTMLYWSAARYREQATAAERAAEIASMLGDEREAIWAESLHNLAMLMLGRLGESVPLLESALPTAEERGDGDTLGWFTVHLGEAYACMGHFDRFLFHMTQARKLAELMGNPINRTYVCYWLGLHAFYIGDWRRAREYFDEGRAIGLLVAITEVRGVAVGYSNLGLGLLSWAQGEDKLSDRYLEDALTLALRGLPPRLIRPVQGCLAERDLLAGSPEDALGRLDPLLETPEGREGIDATALLPLLAWAHLEADNLPRAAEVTAEALDRCRHEHHQLALLDTLRVQALLAIRRERWDESAAALDAALALARPMPYPYAEAKALYVYGMLEAARGAIGKARNRFEQAMAICAQLGEVPYRQRIESALAAL